MVTEITLVFDFAETTWFTEGVLTFDFVLRSISPCQDWASGARNNFVCDAIRQMSRQQSPLPGSSNSHHDEVGTEFFCRLQNGVSWFAMPHHCFRPAPKLSVLRD